VDRLPLSVRAVVAAGLIALLGAGGYFGLVAPKLREVNTLKAQLAREMRSGGSAQPVPLVSPITETERQLWGELEARVRERYPAEPVLPKALGVLADLAGSSGMELVSLEIRRPQTGPAAEPGKPTAPPRFQPPPELALNPSTVTLVAHHRYRDLVEFLERLRRAPVYVAVHSLEVKRVENRLTSEISFVSLRWGQ